MRRVIWLQTPTVFWFDGEITTLSFEGTKPGRMKYITEPTVPLVLTRLVKSLKQINHQVLIKFQHT
jgi:hypothetical protein